MKEEKPIAEIVTENDLPTTLNCKYIIYKEVVYLPEKWLELILVPSKKDFRGKIYINNHVFFLTKFYIANTVLT